MPGERFKLQETTIKVRVMVPKPDEVLSAVFVHRDFFMPVSDKHANARPPSRPCSAISGSKQSGKQRKPNIAQNNDRQAIPKLPRKGLVSNLSDEFLLKFSQS